MRWFVLLAIALRVFANPFDEMIPSAPEEIASLNADLLVDGFVSAASGQISLVQSDLHIKGAQDLYLQRTYIPPQILGRYDDKDEIDRLALGKALQVQARGWVVNPHLLAGYNRNSPYFLVRDPHGTVLEFQIIGNRGHLKTSGNGCSNLKGGEPSAEADIRNIEFLVEGAQVSVIWPNGHKRIYQSQFPGIYHLESEMLPNGKTFRYSYDNNQILARVVSSDVTGKHIYATIQVIADQHYKGSDGKEATLIYERREIKSKFNKNGRKGTATFGIPILTSALNPIYPNTVGYNERTLLTSYDAKNYPISCTYWEQKETPCRIRTFSTPAGSISFDYDPPIAGQKAGSTTVTHPNHSQTIYRFNSQFLLSAIENWYKGKLYNQKIFSYDSKQHISKIETQDGLGYTLLAKTYECDQAGNPILEKWEGDFGLYSIERTFLKNRLTKEVHSDGLGFEYAYLGNTHLLTSKIIISEGKQLRTTKYTYDDAYNLIEEKEVGKTVTNYVLYQEGAHLHLPEWKIEKDWDGQLIHKTRFVYDNFGHVSEEIHYGNDDILAYRTTQLYDSRNNLIEETNPLGQLASYSYDARGRLVKEVPFAQNRIIQRSFDDKGRLITLQEGDHITHFAYNSSDELVKKTNYLGLETDYHYHPVHSKPVWIEEDPTLLEITYDDFGRKIIEKDAYGAATHIQLNSYGDPLSIVRPDGGKETFVYASNRMLLSKIDPDGLKTNYTYDPLKRMLSKAVGTRKTIYTYDEYNLLDEKDSLGISTKYEYNLLGQKTREVREGRVTQFSYDSLGFLSKIEKGGRSTIYQNDISGRVVKTSVDGLLDTFYTYDSAGNIASITKQDSIHFLYDPYNRLIEKVDAEGAKTTFAYEEGNRILKKTTQHPKGVKRIEIYNPKGLLLKREVPTCTLEEYSYDRALRLSSQDHLIFAYTPEGFKSSLTEAKQRTTSWTYTPGGKIETKTKPDGSVLRYEYTEDGDLARVGSKEFEYDAFGRVIRGTGFSREYDPFGNVIKEEFATGITVKTSYDDFDRPIERILPDQSSICYTYEGPFLSKIRRLNSDGNVLYTHTYEQFDLNGHVLSETGLFHCSYSYDRAGRRIAQTNPFFSEELVYDENGNLIRKGTDSYTYDGADQLISSSGHFSLTYDKHFNRQTYNGKEARIDELNQIEGLVFNENGCLVHEGFAYDPFDQLTQANGEKISYDALGRRLQKGTTSYLYFGEEEVGAFEKGKVKELKIPGLLAPIALEIESQPYHPIADVQGTIRMLIDPKTFKVCRENSSDPFGVGLSSEIPYAYAAKRYDPGTGMVYFGKRYYVPTLGRWLTPDPIGSLNHSNLYQYLFNNPYLYQDDHGEFAFAIPLLFWGAELALPTISACVAAISYGAAAGAVAYGGYKLIETLNDRGYPCMGDYYSGDLTPGLNSWSYSAMKSGSVDPSLPANPDDLLKRPGWKETTHPDAGKRGHRTFENGKTGEKLRHDEGKPGQAGHEGHDHYHRPNPNTTSKRDEYLDHDYNPVGRHSDPSHLYAPENIWWNK